MEAMVSALPEVVGDRRPVVAVVSILGDKDAAAMMASLVGAAGRVIATRSSHPRAVPAVDLAAIARALGRPAEAVDPPAAALAAAREAAGPDGVVVVAGSLYLLADLRGPVAGGGGTPPARLARARKGIDVPEAK
jgi:dihydrofolate synthase/folylpolyglutamate synthase